MRIAFLVATCLCSGAIIDRVAIVAGKHPILDSAINKDIRVTAFLNGETPSFSDESRKKAASRLIDQEIIRDQMRNGGYPVAQSVDADQLLAEITKDRFGNDTQFRRALSQAGITADELKTRLLWQMTVLRFIDARFRPAVVVTDEEAKRYYDSHRSEWKGTFEDSRQPITEELSAQRVNALLDEWLAEQRQQLRIEYLEKSLQ